MAGHVVFQCPSCQTRRLTAPQPETGAVSCDGCGWQRDLGGDDYRDGKLCRCRICGCDDLWRQKDFPPALGLAIVAVAAISSCIAWGYYQPAVAIGCLFAAALLDMLLFLVMGDMLVCYRCGARHRQGVVDERHPKFDLETAERYRQLERRRSGQPG
jgi:hypothetical protein